MRLINYLTVIMMTVMLIWISACNEGNNPEIVEQIDARIEENAVAQVIDALKNMPYYGQESHETRGYEIDKEELEIVFKIVIADIYGYISSNSSTTEGRIKDCVTTSAAMAMHIIMQTTKEIESEASVIYLSRYMRNNSEKLENLVFPKSINTLEDSIGYYHNFCLSSSVIDFETTKQLNIDTITYKIERYMPERLSGGGTNISFIRDFFDTKIPAIYESSDVHSAINVFANDKLLVDDFNEIFEPFIMGLYENNGFRDISNYSNSLSVIRSSHLSPDTKKAVENAIVITYASASLWDPKLF